MASLASMLAGSTIGQGAANFVHDQARGAFDRMRMDQMGAQQAQQQKVWDFQNREMDRTKQGQDIESTVTTGATDEDRLNELADIAGKAGRGDLQRKYKAEALKAREAHQLMGIANASRAITLGQFEPAAQMLNQTGLFGQIHGIKLADDVEQDPRNPTYAVVTAGQPDAAGNPTPGQPVHVTQQMLYALQAKPGDALHWLSYAQAQGQRAEGADKDRELRAKRLAETERHNRALEAAKRAGGAAGASGGRLTDQRWRYEWAKSQVGKPGGFTDDKEAMTWATDPQKNSREYWASLRLAGGLQNSGAIFTDPKTGQSNAKDILDGLTGLARELRGSPIAAPNPAAPTAPPAAPKPTAGIDFKEMGFTQDPKTGNWKNPNTGVWFKEEGGQAFAWSKRQSKWVPVQ